MSGIEASGGTLLNEKLPILSFKCLHCHVVMPTSHPGRRSQSKLWRLRCDEIGVFTVTQRDVDLPSATRLDAANRFSRCQSHMSGSGRAMWLSKDPISRSLNKPLGGIR
jgi:hypothetical protein